MHYDKWQSGDSNPDPSNDKAYSLPTLSMALPHEGTGSLWWMPEFHPVSLGHFLGMWIRALIGSSWLLFFPFCFFGCAQAWVLSSWTGIKPVFPAVEALCLNNCTSRKVPGFLCPERTPHFLRTLPTPGTLSAILQMHRLVVRQIDEWSLPLGI